MIMVKSPPNIRQIGQQTQLLNSRQPKLKGRSLSISRQNLSSVQRFSRSDCGVETMDDEYVVFDRRLGLLSRCSFASILDWHFETDNNRELPIVKDPLLFHVLWRHTTNRTDAYSSVCITPP